MDKSRRTALKVIGSTGIFLTAGVGSATARNGKRQGASGDDTIVDVAIAADGFDVLVAAVQEAGLVDTLSGNRQLTVFAPTDQAFEDLADALGVELADLLVRDDLGDILQYHVTSGRRYASSIVNAPQVKTLNGKKVDVDGTELNDGQANIVATDIEASNGVVHVIDGVLLP
ncbi:fasciclin domain-containing protein [Halobacteriaceae archaeon SHR40]|uniref:fasciclin domain-containing protein n=1 Tax=Halovenus amylolytica TaxID=2500550 RepID=UPI000FE2A82B